MKSWHGYALSILAVAGISTAQAGTLFTPALTATYPNEIMECLVVNVGSAGGSEPIRVLVQLIDAGAGVVWAEREVDVAPLYQDGFAVLGGLSGYCAFTVKGSTKGIRANIRVSVIDQGTRASLAAE